MRGLRAKKLFSIFKECMKRDLIPTQHEPQPKLQWRRFKKMFKSGELWNYFPSM